eukprot:1615528-Ditylum_brightwellii.AAC.1
MVHHLLYSEQWEELEHLCNQIPSMALVVDKDGQTPLHLSVYSIQSPPSLLLVRRLLEIYPDGEEVVRILLDVYPEAAKAKDKDGDILNYCCRTIKMTQLLLRHYPKGAM